MLNTVAENTVILNLQKVNFHCLDRLKYPHFPWRGGYQYHLNNSYKRGIGEEIKVFSKIQQKRLSSSSAIAVKIDL